MPIEDDVKKLLGDGAKDDQVSGLVALIKTTTDSEVSGLKSKVDELLKESKTAKEAAAVAEKAKTQAELEAMKKAGDIEAVETRIRAEFEAEGQKKLDEITELKDKILGSHKAAAIASLSSIAANPETATLLNKLADSMVDVTFDDAGNVATTYRGLDGTAIGSDGDKFLEHIQSSSAFATLVKSKAGTGSGATGGGGVKGVKKELGDYTTQELTIIRSENPELYKQVIEHRQAAYADKVSGVQ